jgi:hypothetical protein
MIQISRELKAYSSGQRIMRNVSNRLHVGVIGQFEFRRLTLDQMWTGHGETDAIDLERTMYQAVAGSAYLPQRFAPKFQKRSRPVHRQNVMRSNCTLKQMQFAHHIY